MTIKGNQQPSKDVTPDLLFSSLKQHLNSIEPEYIEEIHQALLLAFAAHQNQYRKSGDLYITHPVAVAEILAKMHLDYTSIIAALLHDVLEDTPTTKALIAQKFGEDVAQLVDGVSKLGNIQFESRAEAQAENFRKMLLAMSDDIRVIIIKLADRLHNMRTINDLSRERRLRIARETLDIFAPIARRLGMHEISLELENLGFQCCYPRRYVVLETAMNEVQVNHQKVIEELCSAIEIKLHENQIEPLSILSREKHLYSIYQKMKLKKISFSELTDVYGLRIIVKEQLDCYRVLGILHNMYKPMAQKFKDYIALPKANGYQSLHTVLFGAHGIPIEIQIRSEIMDHMACRGIAAHWLYKTGDAQAGLPHLKTQQWLQDMIEIQQRTGNSLEFIENVKIDLFPNDVYVFTPKGEIVELPAGATPVDLAYSIHTDIGNHCVAAKVDRQFSPLSSVLRSGQTVEIITHENASPSIHWLNFVCSGKARSGIRHFLRDQQRDQWIRLGEKLLCKSLSDASLDYQEISNDDRQQASMLLGFNRFEELLEDIGKGNRPATLVMQQCFDQGRKSSSEKKSAVRPLIISGTEGMAVEFPSCCWPIPNDPILGLIRRGKGISVHRNQCRELARAVRKRQRTVMVHWAEHVDGEFLSIVRMEVINQRGVLAIIALAVSESRANIEDITIRDSLHRHALIELSLRVTGRVQLANVIKRLRKLKQIVKVYRVSDV